MNTTNEYQNMLNDLRKGLISPRSVVGTGYKNGRKVAFEWIYTQLVNESLAALEKVSAVYVTSSGNPFSSIDKARSSKVYKMLEAGKFKSINELPVIEYGIRSGINGDGFLVWIKVGRRRPLSKVA